MTEASNREVKCALIIFFGNEEKANLKVIFKKKHLSNLFLGKELGRK